MTAPLRRQASSKSSPAKPSRKKLSLLVLLIAIAAYGAYLIIIISTARSPKDNSNPHLSSGRQEAVGVYHLHTRFSDGKGRVEEVVQAAKRNHLDFIILTDHGRPNNACLRSQGWRDGLLVLAGSELSTNRGHLVGLGFSDSIPPLPSKAEEAAYLIQKEGGLAVIAHPFSKTPWSWGEDNQFFTGIELLDADTMFKKNWLASLPIFPLLALKPRVFVLRMIDPFFKSFEQWDLLNRKQPPVYGFFSCDAHLFYGPLLSLFHLRVPLDKGMPAEFSEARQTIFSALKRGAFYNAVDAAQSAANFKFWAERSEEHFSMGSQVPMDSETPLSLRLEIPGPVPTTTVLIRNGQRMFSSAEKKITYEVQEPGVYRVEVYLETPTGLNSRIPWVVSNPIFLAAGKS